MLIFTCAPAALKNATFKRDPQKNHLTSFNNIKSKFLIHGTMSAEDCDISNILQFLRSFLITFKVTGFFAR